MSPNAVSLLFPGRPIRPLPKRSLRERLSPEVIGAIEFPPTTYENVPLFYYPPFRPQDEGSLLNIEATNPIEQSRRDRTHIKLSLRGDGLGVIRGNKDEAVWRSSLVSRPAAEIPSRANRPFQRPYLSRTVNLQSPPLITSLIDGYESFENTNNKKKRKIPIAGESTLNGTRVLDHESSALATFARARSPSDDSIGDKPQQHIHRLPNYGSNATNVQDLSGSGRGRLGRSRHARSPLQSLPDNSGIWAGRPKTGELSMTTGQGASSIISKAIANAEKLPIRSQENVGLLLQHATSGKAMPASTQFTFTCESQVPVLGTVLWPGSPVRPDPATQTALGLTSNANAISNTKQDGSSKASSGRSSNSATKSRHHVERELLGAVRHRRQIATNDYYLHPPKREDVWICEFCEYERIFGKPPRILIRDFEIKDRHHRQEEAERKRLLEKAKAKSRKGKKSGKAVAKASHTINPPTDQLQADQFEDLSTTHMEDAGHGHSTQSEDDYDDPDGDCSHSPQECIGGVKVIHNAHVSPPRDIAEAASLFNPRLQAPS